MTLLTREGRRDLQSEDPRTHTAWLTLSLVSGMYSRRFNHLLEVFSTPEAILASDVQALHATGLPMDIAREISQAGQGKLSETMKAELERCLCVLNQPQQFLLTRNSPGYPALLSCIPDPPPMLFIKGEIDSLSMPMIAIVGSRNPSAGGRRNARCFARELAANGIGVVSGLALGIDVESHCGAIEGGSKTVAALGTGIDKVYPSGNKPMFEKIAENGALITEFLPGILPRPANFPQRNRIISGISQGVLVVEAGLRSGSMITARFALEQGRDVFAIPGSIHNPMAKGCHKLISEGAKLVQGVEDILEEKMVILHKVSDENVVVSKNLPAETLKVKNAIGYDPASLDQLVLETGMEAEQVTAALMELELEGVIERNNNNYSLKPFD